jgi:phosphoglycerate-specific signal transduction histidine kinase
VTVAVKADKALRESQTRLQEMHSELLHVSRLSAMGEMASALAHELNQPLAAISNYMKGSRRLLASSTDPNASKIEEALNKAAEQAIRAGQIIRRLRDFVARGESEKRVESISKLIEEASALGLVGARERGVLLKFNLNPSIDLVVADRVQIQQVLVNLIRNAAEAMIDADKRELTVTTAPAADDMVEIAVSDTGKGLPENVTANLFQPFFTTKEAGMGSGFRSARPSSKLTGDRCMPSQMRPEARPSVLRCRPHRRRIRFAADKRSSMRSMTTPPCPSRCSFFSAMLGMDGIGLLRHLRRERPTISVIVITGRGDVPWPSKR